MRKVQNLPLAGGSSPPYKGSELGLGFLQGDYKPSPMTSAVTRAGSSWIIMTYSGNARQEILFIHAGHLGLAHVYDLVGW